MKSFNSTLKCVCLVILVIDIFCFVYSYFAFVPETSKTFRQVTSKRFLNGGKFNEIVDRPMDLVVEEKIKIKDGITGRTVYPCK